MADDLRKLYDAVSSEFNIGDYNTFQSKMQTPEERKRFYDAISNNGLDLGDYNTYEDRLSVKKKEPSIPSEGLQGVVSPTQKADTASTLPNTSLAYTEPNNAQVTQQQPRTEFVTKEEPKRKEFVTKATPEEGYKAPGVTQTTEELKAEGAKPAGPKDYFDQSLDYINKDFASKDEFETAQMLNNKYQDYGFAFHPTGIGSIVAESKNGERKTIRTGDAEELKDFLANNRVKSKSLEGAVKTDEKIISEDELKDKISSFDKEAQDFNALKKEYVKLKAENLKADSKFKNMTPEQISASGDQQLQQQYQQWDEQRKRLAQIDVAVADREKSMIGKGAHLDKIAGDYTLEKSKVGTFGGALYNSVIGSIVDVSKGLAELGADAISAVVPPNMVLSDKEYKELYDKYKDEEKARLKDREAKKGILGEIVDFATLDKQSEQQKLDLAIDDRIRAELKNKFLKGKNAEVYRNPYSEVSRLDTKKAQYKGIDFQSKEPQDVSGLESIGALGVLEEGLKGMLESKGTTKEYIQKTQQNIIPGAIIGIGRLVPMLFSGGGVATMAAGIASGHAERMEEMDKNPAFDKKTSQEKQLASLPFDLIDAALWSEGFSDLMNKKSVLNPILARVITKFKGLPEAAAGDAVKTFEQLVKDDIKNVYAKKGLEAVSSFGAGAQFGAVAGAADIAAKEAYNFSQGEKMFETPESLLQGAKQIGQSMISAGLGGIVLHTPTLMASTKPTEIGDFEFEVFKGTLTDDQYEKIFTTRYKQRILNGDISYEDAVKDFDNYKQLKGLMQQLGNDLTLSQQKEGLELLNRKQQLEKEIDGKSKEVYQDKIDEINGINEELKTLKSRKYTLNGEEYSKNEIIKKIDSMSKEELDNVKFKVDNDPETEKILETKIKENAIQEPSTETGVLRPTEPQLELPKVGEGNAQEQAVAEEVKPTEVAAAKEGEVKLNKETFTEDVTPEQRTKIEEQNTADENESIDEIYEFNDEIKSIGTKEQFKSFLKTLVPEGAFSRLGWHNTSKTELTPREKQYYTNTRRNAEETYKEANTFPALIFGDNPKKATFDEVQDVDIPAAKAEGADIVITDDLSPSIGIDMNYREFVTVDPSKVIPLGTKENIEAFKSFVESKPAETTPAKAEPVKAEPKKGKGKAKAAEITPEVKAEPVKAEPVKAEPTKAEPAKAEPAEPKLTKRQQDQIEILNSQIEYSERTIENHQEEIENVKSNFKEDEQRIREEMKKVKESKMKKAEKEEKLDDLRAELEDLRDERDTYIEQYQEDIKLEKADLKKANKALEKLQRPEPKGKFEAKAQEIADKIEAADIPDWLISGNENITRQGGGIDQNTLKKMLSKAVVEVGKMMDRGMELAEAIKEASKDLIKAVGANKRQDIERFIESRFKQPQRLSEKEFPEKAAFMEKIEKVVAKHQAEGKDYDSLIKRIDTAINKLKDLTPEQKKMLKAEAIEKAENTEFDKILAEVDKKVARQKKNNKSYDNLIKNIDTFVRESDVYKSATDARKKEFEMLARERAGQGERRAPSIGRILGALKDMKNLSREEKLRMVTKIRELATDAVKDLTTELRLLSDGGKIEVRQMNAILNRFGKVNMLNERSVSSFVDYMDKVFKDAAYAEKLNTAYKLQGQIESLSKNKDKNNDLTKMGKQFAEINPERVEDLDEYNAMAAKIKESIEGTTMKAAKEGKFADIVKISEVNAYTEMALESQNKQIAEELSEQIKDILGVDVGDLTYEDMLNMVENTKDNPMTEENKKLVRDYVNKYFEINSALVEDSITKGVDSLTGEKVEYTEEQKRIAKEFMDMDLNLLSEKEALKASEALANFLQNKSTAGMDATLGDYEGRLGAKKILDKGIKARTVSFLGIKGLGRAFNEQISNLNIMMEDMFGGFTKSAQISEAMGLSKVLVQKAKALREARRITAEYVDEFYKQKANGEEFNTKYNMIERGMLAEASRTVAGNKEKIQQEFNKTKRLVEESIEQLKRGTDNEKKLAEVYEKAYDKILKDSNNSEEVRSKTDKTNVEAVDWWVNEWDKHYDEFADVSKNVYNTLLGRDINYTPRKFTGLENRQEKTELLSDEEPSMFQHNGMQIVKSKSGNLREATRPGALPRTKNGDKVASYLDLSFDVNNANSIHDVLVDIKTVKTIRQMKAFLNSKDFDKIVPNEADANLLKRRVDLLTSNIRRKNVVEIDELHSLMKQMNTIAKMGVGQALGGLTQPIKQVIPIMVNTLMNSGRMPDFIALANPDAVKFIMESGYSIANRGIESQAEIKDLHQLIDDAAEGNMEKVGKWIEKRNEQFLQTFLVNPDVWVAKASWLSYYKQALEKQGQNTDNIDWATHQLNKEAADYAQQMIDRQQNISDHDLAGKFFVKKDATSSLVRQVLMPFASFRLNQTMRMYNDFSILRDPMASREDKIIAARSLVGSATEMATFKLISAGISMALGSLGLMISGKEESEKDYEKRKNNVIKGQATGTVTDVVSPLPLFDVPIQHAVFQSLKLIQELQGKKEKDIVNIFEPKGRDYLQMLGTLGITGDRAVKMGEMAKLAWGSGEYKDDYGNTKTIDPEDQENLKLMVALQGFSALGLVPAETNTVINDYVKDIKKYTKEEVTKEKASEEAAKTEQGILKKLISRYSESRIGKALRAKFVEANDPDIKAERNKADKEQKEKLLGSYQNEEEMKRYNRAMWNKKFGPNSKWFKEHQYQEKADKLLEKEKQRIEDIKHHYTPPVQEHKKKKQHYGDKEEHYSFSMKRKHYGE